MRKLFTVLAMSVALLGLVATPVSAAAPEKVGSRVYVPIVGCQEFTFGLFTLGVFYDGHNSRFQSGTYRTARNCQGGQVRATLIEWIPMPPAGFRCGYIQPVRYTLSGVFIAAGASIRTCIGQTVPLGTYAENSRLGFRWWTEYPQYNNDQRWAHIVVRM